MGLFNFGRKQRMNTELYGNTTGREMFKVGEYNNIKRTNIIFGTVIGIIFTILYFAWKDIPDKIKIFLFLVCIGCGIGLYFGIKHQIKVRKILY